MMCCYSELQLKCNLEYDFVLFHVTVKSMAKSSSKSLEPTPLVRQYRAIKMQHPDHVVFFRCGDFYEMFFEDAKTAHNVLGITLTQRGTDTDGSPVPLAGVPYHSVESYLSRMVRAGYRVAICEQMENPKHAKGVVKREVVRVVTPGTVLEESLLDNKTNNYIVGLVADSTRQIFGLATLDFSTGYFAIAEFHGSNAKQDCANEISRVAPAEIVLSSDQREMLEEMFGLDGRKTTRELIEENEPIPGQRCEKSVGKIVTVDAGTISPWISKKSLIDLFQVRDLNGFGADECTVGLQAAAAILAFIKETQRNNLTHINELRVYHPGEYMVLDATTQRSLELVTNLNDATKRHTLLEVLDKTLTPMGGRLLRQWILQPLRNPDHINDRIQAVGNFVDNWTVRQEAMEALRGINDMERIISRCACKTSNARDLVSLRESLGRVPKIQKIASAMTSSLLKRLTAELDSLDELRFRLEKAVNDQPPVSIREGGMIRQGYNPGLDDLRQMAGDSKSWIASMRQQEIEATGITNLKISYNRVFGYYIEVTNSYLEKVPPHYIRKQTLVGAERFITPELKEKEDIILHAEERIQELEFELFEELRLKVVEATRSVQKTARAVAIFDVLFCLGTVAVANNYCPPTILKDEGRIEINAGRHPVIESLDMDQAFVSNDTELDRSENQILLITGPNMAGKSTYIRQVALITLMAHIGSYVPATWARITTVDRIFTRVGAMDQLARGQSTFLVEMSETANILNNASDKSLVILDEIGRGTSTYDGLSIAWSVVEYLHNTAGSRPLTLFATHYHELAELEGPLPRLKNYNVAVVEEQERVAFLYSIVRGSTDHSYGIYAAQVAGLPKTAISRAKQILRSLEDGRNVEVTLPENERQNEKNIVAGGMPVIKEKHVQLSLFDLIDDPILEKLRNTNPNELTPIQALQLVSELVEEARKI